MSDGEHKQDCNEPTNEDQDEKTTRNNEEEFNINDDIISSEECDTTEEQSNNNREQVDNANEINHDGDGLDVRDVSNLNYGTSIDSVASTEERERIDYRYQRRMSELEDLDNRMLRNVASFSSWLDRSMARDQAADTETLRTQQRTTETISEHREDQNIMNAIGTVRSIASNLPPVRNQNQRTSPIDALPGESMHSSMTGWNPTNTNNIENPRTNIVVPVSEVSVLDNHDRRPVLEGYLISPSTPVIPEVQQDPACCGGSMTVKMMCILVILSLIIVILTVLLVFKQDRKSELRLTKAPIAFTSRRPSQYVKSFALPSSLPNTMPSHAPSETVAPSYFPSSPLEWNKLETNIVGFAPAVYFGKNLAFANEGKRVCIGGLGVLRIYGYTSGGSWSLENDLSSYFEGKYNFSMSLSSDGKSIIVGASRCGGQNPGFAMVFREDNGGRWARIGILRGETVNECFGTSVAIKKDGTLIAVSNTIGRVMLFRWQNEEFVLEKKLEIDISSRGSSPVMSMVPDGSMLVVGDHLNNKVSLFSLLSYTLLQTIVPGNNVYGFGAQVFISDNKSCIAISSIMKMNERVEIFRPELTAIYQKSEIILSPEIDNYYFSFSVCGECKRIVISAPHWRMSKGKIYLFTFRRDKWDFISEIEGEVEGNKFGHSVALSSHSDFLAIGSPGHKENVGLVEVFTLTGGFM